MEGNQKRRNKKRRGRRRMDDRLEPTLLSSPHPLITPFPHSASILVLLPRLIFLTVFSSLLSNLPLCFSGLLALLQRAVDLVQGLFDAQRRQPGRGVLVPALLHQLHQSR